MFRPKAIGLCALSVLGLAALSSPAHADLTLTAAGVAAGFTLSTFADGFPNASGIGPLGIAFNARSAAKPSGARRCAPAPLVLTMN